MMVEFLHALCHTNGNLIAGGNIESYEINNKEITKNNGTT